MSWNRYEEARCQYIPPEVRLLFVGEAPPSSPERYFYFPDVLAHDSLWTNLMKALYQSEFGETKIERRRKHQWLTRFSEDSNLLIDVLKEPLPSDSDSPTSSPKERVALLHEQIGPLIAECRKICPRQILLIKATVYDAVYEPLKAAGLPVVDARLPFPGSGKQREFLNMFATLVREGTVVPKSASD